MSRHYIFRGLIFCLLVLLWGGNFFIAVGVLSAAFPNDPLFSQQWYLQPINIKTAWSKQLLLREQERSSQRSVIAILDTGVDTNHPDLQGKVWRNTDEIPGDGIDNDGNGYVDDYLGWDFVESDNDPRPSLTPGYNSDAVSHGTLVAGVAAASVHNAEGIAGVSWFSDIMPLRVLDSTGSGDVSDVVAAINYAVNNGADVINMSFVGDKFSESLFTAIRRAYQQGVVVVAAAGNTDPQVNGINLDVTPSYPVCYDGTNGENYVIGVASVGRTLQKSSFSNFGKCIDVVAPGEGFVSTGFYSSEPAFTDLYSGTWSGTSLSAPLVSGLVGMLRSIRPGLRVDDIIAVIRQSAQPVDQYNSAYSGKLGTGIIDAAAAFQETLGTKVSRIPEGENNYLVAGLGYGLYPQVKVVKTDGSELKSFYAYSPTFSGGVNVAVGDVNGDGQDEIITGAGQRGGPHVRIFNIEGQLLAQFFAYDKDFRGGVTVAVGDVDGNGTEEVITGPGPGMAPIVKVFSMRGELIREFLVYAQHFQGGVNVGVGDVDGFGVDEIVVGAATGGGPHVRVFNGRGELVSQFFAFNEEFRGGVTVSVGDIHGDGKAEIAAAIQSGGVSTIRLYSHTGKLESSFFAFEPSYVGGVYTTIGDVDRDGVGDIVVGPRGGREPVLRVFNWRGEQKIEISVQSAGYTGAVLPAVFQF